MCVWVLFSNAFHSCEKHETCLFSRQGIFIQIGRVSVVGANRKNSLSGEKVFFQSVELLEKEK